MILRQINIKNFKGIKDLTISFQDKTKILGDNATGKTSIFDAFTWCLFDKDSLSSSKFEIKPIGSEGVKTEVELIIDEPEITIKKVQKEVWKSKRGSIQKTFSGFTAEYFIDDVPKKKKDFQINVHNIIDEKIFNLITSPSVFPNTHWTEQRKILLEMCSKEKFEEFECFQDELKKHKVAKKELEDRIQAIPDIIKELKKDLKPDLKIDKLTQVQCDLRNEISHLIHSKEDTNKSQLINELKIDLEKEKQELIKSKLKDSEEKSRLEREINSIVQEIGVKIDSLNISISNNNRSIDKKNLEVQHLQRTLQNRQEELNLKNEAIVLLRKEFKGIEELHFDKCDKCGQEISDEAANHLKTFMKGEINQKGQTLKKDISSIKEDINNLFKEIEHTNDLIKDLNYEKSEYQNEISLIEAEIKEKTKDLKEKFEEEKFYDSSKIKNLESRIYKLENEPDSANKEIDEKIANLELDLQAVEGDILNYRLSEDQSKKIKELKKELKEKNLIYASILEVINQAENNISDIIESMQDEINSNFKMAVFRLFKKQINGEIVETCEVTYKEVPYSSLNNGARINIGLDIINILCKKFNANAPIFIDNAESVTDILKTESQQIHLIVDEKEKELKVTF